MDELISQNKLKAEWVPYWEPRIQGLNKQLGNFWITLDDRHEIAIEIVAPAEGVRYVENGGYFASFTVHYDGIVTMRALDECGFLKRFEETPAQTFYDVFYCLHASDIPVRSYEDDNELIGSRKMYELLTEKVDNDA